MVKLKAFLLPKMYHQYYVIPFVLKRLYGRDVAVFNAVGRVVYSAVSIPMPFYDNGVVNMRYCRAAQYGVYHILVVHAFKIKVFYMLFIYVIGAGIKLCP